MEMASPEELAELENVSDIEPETDLGLGQAEEGEQSKDPAELIEEPSDALEGWLKGHPAKRTSIKDQSEEEDDRDADQLMNELDSLIGNVGKTPPLKNLATTGSDNFEIREITADTKKK
jgi:hypothetical protein